MSLSNQVTRPVALVETEPVISLLMMMNGVLVYTVENHVMTISKWIVATVL
jgi:hypothetical protein